MSLPAHRSTATFREYVALEAYSNVKHEYIDGWIVAMAGGTPEHAALGAAVVGHLFAALPARCRVYSSDLRVRTPDGLATYPDVTVVCGRNEVDPEDVNTVVNPIVLVEITSPSSEDYDRGDKRSSYLGIPSLREYMIVSHRERAVDVVRREVTGGWSTVRAVSGDVVGLESIGVTFAVDSIFDRAAEV